MSNLYYKKPQSKIDLDTLPDFLKEKSPKVKFHSAFPPLTTKVRVRSVMERAGFDVYRPEKDRSISMNNRNNATINSLSSNNDLSNGSFIPPNKILNSHNKKQSRSYSHNAIATNTTLPLRDNQNSDDSLDKLNNNQFQDLSKSRNFTTNPNNLNNSSTPNLLNNHSPTHSNINNMETYAREKLNLPTMFNTTTTDNTVPLTNDLKDEGLIIPDIQFHQNGNESETDNSDSLYKNKELELSLDNDADAADNSVIIHDNEHPFGRENNDFIDEDPFKQSTALPPRQIPQISGPRPYYDSENEDEINDDINQNRFSNNRDSTKTTNTEELKHYFSSNDTNPNVLNVESNNNDKLSHKSVASIGSFDDKFMASAEDNEHNISQDSFGGLTSMRKNIQSTEFEGLPLVPDITSPYQDTNVKRLSTLGTNDMNIYNLQSLNDGNLDNSNEMSMIQEGEIEDSRIDYNNTSIPEIENASRVPPVLIIPEINEVDEIESNEKSLLEEADMNHSNLSHHEIPQITTESDSILNEDINDADDVKGDVENDIDNSSSHSIPQVSDNALSQLGFTKRTAITTPNINNNQTIPPTSEPVIPSIDDYQNEGQNEDPVSKLIDNIEKFDMNDPNYDNLVLPPRHFEKQVPLDNELPTKVHPYAALSFDSKTNSISSNPPLRSPSTGLTTPDHDLTYEDKFENEIKQQNIDETIDNHIVDNTDNDDNIHYQQTEEIIYPPGEGPCRKCGLEIFEHEKKIWSKDHQLTGQWHRKCFGCNTCNAKFNKGSSCYVFNNQPYCESHFHELNGSLCQVCHKGVEGECLQNDVSEAFHIDCLKCVICGLNVEGDYFIFRDEVMCETDANELMYQIEQAEKDYNNKNKDIDKIIKRRTRVLYV